MAEIKRIQLRGISRAPSDRLTEDGGVLESINAYLDGTEVAAMPEEKDVTTKYLQNYKDIDYVHLMFLHKVGDVTNTLYVRHAEGYNYALVLAGSKDKTIHYFDSQVTELKSLGNTIVALTANKGQEFLLWQNGEYRYLGSQIPIPHLQVQTTPYMSSDAYSRISLLENTTQSATWTALNVTAWNTAAKNKDAQMSTVADTIWAEIQKKKKDYASKGYFTNPVLLRTAVKLRGGGYVHQSVPILIGAGVESFVTLEGEKDINQSAGTSSNYLKVKLENIFKATGYFGPYQAEEWADIIESVDIFMSEEIYYPLLNARFSNMSQRSASSTVVYYNITFDNGDKSSYEAIEQEVLSKAVFSKIASYPIASLQGLDKITLLPKSAEELAIAEKMPEYDGNSNLVKLESVYNLNDRMLGEGKEEVLATGYKFLPSTAVTKTKYITRNRTNMFAYHVGGSDGVTHKVIGKTSTGDTKFNPYAVKLQDEAGSATVYCGMYGFIFFPDANCYLCEVWDTSGDVIEIPMKPHPFLNCSYGYWGMGTEIEEADLIGASDVTESLFLSGENRAVSKLRTLYLSDYANPFALHAANKVTFSSSIKAIAPAVLPMSPGQYGQTPIYVFCEDAIYTLSMNEDGTIKGKDLVSHDGAIGPVCPIEQGVVFISPEGVMLLEGQNRVCLSKNLSSRKNSDAYENINKLLTKNGWAALDNVKTFAYEILVNHTTRIGYDYASKMLFFVVGEQWCCYDMKTATWHTFTGEYVNDFLNAFPKLVYQTEREVEECWVAYIASGREPTDKNLAGQKLTSIFGSKYSALDEKRKKAILEGKDVILLKGWTYEQVKAAVQDAYGEGLYINEEAWEITTPGAREIVNPKIASGKAKPVTIITRPFDLGHPDVLKSISDIRVRGDFLPGTVKYILEGSNNGRDFYVLNSLRGRSWKLFRITLLAELTCDERISWIDVMYETRYTNRLR